MTKQVPDSSNRNSMHYFSSTPMNCSLSKYLPTASSVHTVFLSWSAMIDSKSLVKQLCTYFSSISEPKIATSSDLLAGKYPHETQLETTLAACMNQVSQQLYLIQNPPGAVLSELFYIARISIQMLLFFKTRRDLSLYLFKYNANFTDYLPLI